MRQALWLSRDGARIDVSYQTAGLEIEGLQAQGQKGKVQTSHPGTRPCHVGLCREHSIVKTCCLKMYARAESFCMQAPWPACHCLWVTCKHYLGILEHSSWQPGLELACPYCKLAGCLHMLAHCEEVSSGGIAHMHGQS